MSKNFQSLRRVSSSRRHPGLSLLDSPESTGASARGPQIILPDGRVAAGDMLWGGNSFEAANQSTSRGYIFFPSLDTRHEINATNRTEVMRKVRWLYNNDPFSRRCINAIARMIGFCLPKPETPDREWNALAKRVYLDIKKSRNRFDRSGKYNFFSYQLNLNRLEIKDGDALTVPTLSKEGSTQMMCYEGHQVGNDLAARGREDQDQWFDGVRCDRHGKALAYRILHPGDPGKSKVVPNRSAHLFARYERPGQVRGISACAPMVNYAIDVREIQNDMGSGMKARQLIGFYLAAQQPDLPFGTGQQGMQNSLKKWKNTNTPNEGTGDTEQDETIPYEEVFQAGNMFRAEGYEPKVLESSQPHENEMAFLDWKIRMMALCFDIAPQMVWEIGQLNGNTQRWVSEDTQEMIDMRRMETLIPFCQWDWFMTIGAEIESGRLREPKIPQHLAPHVGWWTCEWIPTRRKTIDRGREGKLRIEERRALLQTFDSLYSEVQKDWTEETDQWLHEIDHIASRMKDMGWPDSRIEIVLANLLAPPPGTSLLDLNEDDPDGLTVPDDEADEITDDANSENSN